MKTMVPGAPIALSALVVVASVHARAVPEPPIFNSSRSLLGASSAIELAGNFIITLKDENTAPLNAMRGQQFASRAQMLTSLQASLESHASRSQKTIRELINNHRTEHVEGFWITNQLYVRGVTSELLAQIRAHPNVLSVEPDQLQPMVQPTFKLAASSILSFATSSWGTTKINAPLAWAKGATGEGIVVGSIDSGVRASHEALTNNFRKSFGWYDPEFKTSVPYDATGHGTHVAGIIAGAKGVGVAPMAQWIACKGCRATGCLTSDILACMQFMLCPTTTDGSLSDCSKAPQVVNNSWAGNKGVTTFNAALAAWRAARIIPVFASGNSGPTCGSVLSPGDQSGVLTVGATDSIDGIARFSGKGPTAAGLLKPDVMAPGVLVRSSCYGSDKEYCTMSGTSMATPHVTGTIALLLSLKPTLTYDQIRTALLQSASRASLKLSGMGCGLTPDGKFPNNMLGYGRVDALKLLTT